MPEPMAGQNGPGTIVITGTGLYTPPESISNAELVASLSAATDLWNTEHGDEIAAGQLIARANPDETFILKASGIRSRYVVDKDGVLDPKRLRPHLRLRSEDELGLQAEFSLPAVHQALEMAGRVGRDVDAIIVGCSNLERAYPAVSIEIQAAIGARGWAYDMNVACSSATFSMQAAADALRSGSANCVVVVNPEITSGHNNFELRDFHFIFGDACTALVLERAGEESRDAGTSAAGVHSAPSLNGDRWAIRGSRLATQFS
ncbi:MAG: beta-ketoacyl-ACP synthase III, partial [Ilumatobacteraceae bacterium]